MLYAFQKCKHQLFSSTRLISIKFSNVSGLFWWTLYDVCVNACMLYNGKKTVTGRLLVALYFCRNETAPFGPKYLPQILASCNTRQFQVIFLCARSTETVLCLELSRYTSLAFLALHIAKVAFNGETKTSDECNGLSFIVASTFGTFFLCFLIVPSSVVFSAAFSLFAKFIGYR